MYVPSFSRSKCRAYWFLETDSGTFYAFYGVPSLWWEASALDVMSKEVEAPQAVCWFSFTSARVKSNLVACRKKSTAQLLSLSSLKNVRQEGRWRPLWVPPLQNRWSLSQVKLFRFFMMQRPGCEPSKKRGMGQTPQTCLPFEHWGKAFGFKRPSWSGRLIFPLPRKSWKRPETCVFPKQLKCRNPRSTCLKEIVWRKPEGCRDFIQSPSWTWHPQELQAGGSMQAQGRKRRICFAAQTWRTFSTPASTPWGKKTA